MESVVLSLGGSLLFHAEGGLDSEYIREVASCIRTVARELRVFVVVGGGRLAREYISVARGFNLPEALMDELGIAATRMNARIVISAVGEMAYPEPIKRFEAALVAASSYPVVVMGGTHPGHTTDAVSSFLAEVVRAVRFVNATNVDGVYTADPRSEPAATLIERMDHARLKEIVRGQQGAGVHVVLDPLAAQVLARSAIPTYIINGRDLKNLCEALYGRPCRGTLVTGGE